ncbi:hypothetical protein AB7102_10765 [Providencia manganoxydans]|uniref:hypothetical protein n=1 Tax=Providencia TaxID=586 RepID=UPI001ADCBEE5|nr:hypothetical protein [Providencia rettgeri]MBO8255489.1 hypothetical protein [Providencia rettgeri]MBO8259531.1 hypothetical protein [Providencia rettgeri]
MSRDFNYSGVSYKDMYQEMKNDFYFIILNKKDFSFNREAIPAEHINMLNQEYIIYGQVGKAYLNLIHEISYNFSGVIDGKIHIPGGNKFYTTLNNQLKKKAKMYERINNYHYQMISLNKDIHCFCFSLMIDANNMFSDIAGKKVNNLNRALKLFFNNIRSLVIVKENIMGYFWVSLLHPGFDNEVGRYFHVNFYVKKGGFNNLFFYQINDAWLDVLLSLGLGGRILHFSSSPDTYLHNHEGLSIRYDKSLKNKHREKEERRIIHLQIVDSEANKKNIYFYPDWNNSEYNYEHFCENIKNKKHFHTYLSSLVKKSFSISGYRDYSTASIQTSKSKINKDKIKKDILKKLRAKTKA